MSSILSFAEFSSSSAKSGTSDNVAGQDDSLGSSLGAARLSPTHDLIGDGASY